jgi:hypothetical protein
LYLSPAASWIGRPGSIWFCFFKVYFIFLSMILALVEVGIALGIVDMDAEV